MWHALDQDSQTPLVAAVHAGCLDVVGFLGADRSNMHHKVQWAAQHGHLQVSRHTSYIQALPFQGASVRPAVAPTCNIILQCTQRQMFCL